MQTTKNRTILLISNKPGRLENLSLTLQQIGYKVLATNDGQIGFRLTRRESPDLVISEINLPGISGLELCRMIRADRELWTIPLVFLGELRQESTDIVEILCAGADDWLAEFSNPRYLEAKIEWLIGRKQSENSLTQNYKLLHCRQDQITQIIKGACSLFTVSEIDLNAAASDELGRRQFEKNLNGKMMLGMNIVKGLAFLLEKHLKAFETWEDSRRLENFTGNQEWDIEKRSSDYECVVHELIDEELPTN